MKPWYVLLLCLPAALAVVACVCGLAVLWSPAVQPPKHPTGGRRHGGRNTV